ncbi:hypothetical protein TNCV_2352291 [Trichonephila clavipes]|nr:hypothetical protein TNCV_2352291 [Trichonephila clavipes]
MSLININTNELIEIQQKSKESAPSIQKIENGMNNEVRDQEIAPMQLVPVRREIFSKLNVDRVGPLSITPGNKYILPNMCMSPRHHESVPVSLRKEEFKANVAPAPVDDVADQERMLLLPEEVGEKCFLESMCPLHSEIDSSNKGYARTVLRVPAGREQKRAPSVGWLF